MLEDRVGLPEDEREMLARAVARQRSLAEVVQWGLLQTPPRLVADVIVQDEFTHDVILPWRDLWLVYDTT